MTKIQLHYKSYDLKALKKAFTLTKKLANRLSDNSICFNFGKKDLSLFTVIRSPHVHKKSREQFQLAQFHRFFTVKNKQNPFFLNSLKTISFYGVQVKCSFNASSFSF